MYVTGRYIKDESNFTLIKKMFFFKFNKLFTGRKQALYTGERLSVLDYPWTSITQSTMTRAMETCSLIQKHLPTDIPLSSTDLLREGAPFPPDPPTTHWKPDLYVSNNIPLINLIYILPKKCW